MEKVKPSQLLIQKYLRGSNDSTSQIFVEPDLSAEERLEVLKRIQKLCEDDTLFDQF